MEKQNADNTRKSKNNPCQPKSSWVDAISSIGMWLSLVERCVRDAETGGSNPLIPTTRKRGVRCNNLAPFLFQSNFGSSIFSDHPRHRAPIFQTLPRPDAQRPRILAIRDRIFPKPSRMAPLWRILSSHDNRPEIKASCLECVKKLAPLQFLEPKPQRNRSMSVFGSPTLRHSGITHD